MTTVKINGMSCQHCVASVKKALEEIEGISEVNVDLEAAEASFTNKGVDLLTIRETIVKIGFEPL